METFKIILQQLGGNKFIAMTGATCFSDGDALVIKFKGSKKANYVHIRLNSMDLYDMQFKKIRGMDVKLVSEKKNVYADTLTEIFERETDLCTSL